MSIEDDYIHCCPHGYRCDVEHGKCQKGESIPWLTKTIAQPIQLTLSIIQCPGL